MIGRRVVITSALLLTFSSVGGTQLSAQVPDPAAPALAVPGTPGLELRPDTVRMPGPGGSIVAGLLGGALGLVGGGVAGFYAGGGDGEGGGLEGAFWGAVAGEAIGLSLGVHLGNQRRGNFGGDLLRALLVSGAVATALVVIVPSQEVGTFAVAATPVFQLAWVVPLERRTGVSRARRGLANR